MKKIILIMLGVFTLNAFASCDKPIAQENLPEKAKVFLSTYFKGIDVLSAKKDGLDFEVKLVNGTEIDFDSKGEWKDVDCKTLAVPTGIVPSAISNYVKNKFFGNFIVKIERKKQKYEIELDNDIELVFDKNGAFLYVE